MSVMITCTICGEIFEAKTKRSKYCSRKCKSKAYEDSRKITKVCEYCGKGFSGRPEGRFCSLTCSSVHMHGNMQPKVLTCVDCGVEFEFKGSTVKLRCEECNKIYTQQWHREWEINSGRILKPNVGKGGNVQRGENHHTYKSGIGSYRARRISYLNDSGKPIQCEECGSTTRLEVHHIDEDRTNNDVHNLILLCKCCHKDKHIKRDDLGRFI